MRVSFEGVVNVLVYVEADELMSGGSWNGRLFLLGENKSWPATSGPYGKGVAPKGEYQVVPAKAVDPTVPTNSPFCDPSGNAWFAPLSPQFKTDRTGLGIHPDGNVPGTQGCIGIKGKDTSDLFKILQQPHVLYVV